MKNEYGVEIYETLSEEDSDYEVARPEELPNSEICREIITPDQAVACFLTTSSESVADKIARIRREIAEIRAEAAPELVSELRRALSQPVGSSPNVSSPPAPAAPASTAIAAKDEFAQLELRVTQLESCLGSSLRNPQLKRPLASTIADLQTMLNLLSSDPDLVASRLQKLVALTPTVVPASPGTEVDSINAQITWLYQRLQTLEPSLRQIPAIVSRLQTLRLFHTRTLDTHEQIKAISESLMAMQGEIAEWKEVLHRLEQL